MKLTQSAAETSEKLQALLREQLKKLSAREKIIVSIACGMIAITLAYQVYKPVRNAFQDQARRAERIQEQLKPVSTAIARYSRLKARKAAIELAYKEVEIKEGMLSNLENLVRNQAGISSGFTIHDRPEKTIGDNYRQAPFSIKFVITDFPRLISFLKELVHGEHPMILTKLDLKKRPAGDALEVEMEVNSVYRVGRQNPA